MPTRARRVGRGGLHRFRSRSFGVDALVAFLRTQPDVRFAEPNYVVRTTATPNDQFFPLLWGLLNTGQSVNGAAEQPEPTSARPRRGTCPPVRGTPSWP